ncbi:hypothetical protein QVD17_26231 [Tagetes erecta]|uniref:Uncharacterized protein n=1 Tax=Tagetes erecta TaxID=13708 RepID=A0AAD8NPX1_TARER|nr:hypothetical protein QVD17_26231 [Tagetes erecta]
MIDHHEEQDPTSTCASNQISIIDASIKDVVINKDTLVSKMESVMSLMREVERQETAAKQAKEEADQSVLDILLKLDQCKIALRDAHETNDMLARKLYVQKAVLATKMEVFQLRTLRLLDDGDRFLELVDEMSRSLEIRLTSALNKKELAFKKKQETQTFAQAALAYEEIKTNKLEQESKSLKQETSEISKLLEFLIDRGRILDKLHGEIHNANQLKQELDQGLPLTSILASSLRSFRLEGNNENLDFETEMSSDGMQPADVECHDDLLENPRDVEVCGNKPCAKGSKKAKVKMNFKFAKRVKIKGLEVRMVAADQQVDSSDDINSLVASLIILLIVVIFIYVLDVLRVSVFY